MSVKDKIIEIEEEMSRTQKNKATEHHLGLLKAKIAKLRKEMLSSKKAGGGSAGGFDVKKSGDSTVVLIGLPSTGKSTLQNLLTGTKSETASYQFTTLTCIPGVMHYKGAKIQVLDLPGIIEGASSGAGKGKEILSVARSADLVLFITDVYKPDRELLVRELENFGIRVDCKAPRVDYKKKTRGGLTINTTVKQTKMNIRTIKSIFAEYNLHNADVVIHEDITVDRLIDALIGNRIYTNSLTVLNKIDLVTPEYFKQIKHKFIPISADSGEGTNELKEIIFEKLDLMRIYTKPRGEEADMTEPMMLRNKSRLSDACRYLHRDLLTDFRYAFVWGPSAKHPGQKIGKRHILKDGDIIQIITNTGNTGQ